MSTILFPTGVDGPMAPAYRDWTGTVFDHAGTTAPKGALACPLAPTNISRTTYANLFAVIGTTWGAGDGTTTFGMPYFPADMTGVQANGNVGTNTAGVPQTHVHGMNFNSQVEDAVHNHPVGDPGHFHSEILDQQGPLGASGSTASLMNVNTPQARSYNTNTGFTGISLGNQSANHHHQVVGSTDTGTGLQASNYPAGMRLLKCIWI